MYVIRFVRDALTIVLLGRHSIIFKAVLQSGKDTERQVLRLCMKSTKYPNKQSMFGILIHDMCQQNIHHLYLSFEIYVI